MRGRHATRARFGAIATAPATPPGTDVRLDGVPAVVRATARAESRSPPGDHDASASASASASAMASTSATSAGARLSPVGDLELSARAKRDLQRHLRRVHARINDSAQAKEASEKMREYVRERRVRAERALARKPGRLAAPPKTYEVGGDDRDAVREAAARALAAGVRRRTPDTAAALAERSARLAAEAAENADADADAGGGRPPRRVGRPGRPPLAPVPPRDAETFFAAVEAAAKTPPTWDGVIRDFAAAGGRRRGRGRGRGPGRGRGHVATGTFVPNHDHDTRRREDADGATTSFSKDVAAFGTVVTIDDADALPTLAGGFGVTVAAPPVPRLVSDDEEDEDEDDAFLDAYEDEDDVGDFPSPAPSAAAAFIGAGMYRTSPAAFSTPDREFDASPAPSFGGFTPFTPENDRFRRSRVPEMTPPRALPAMSDDEDDEDEYDDEDSFGAFGDFPTPGLPDFTPTRTEVTPGRYGDRGFRALGPLETPSPRSLAIRREEENAMATRIQALGRGHLARVEYRARLDAARRAEAAARLEAENADVVGEPTFRDMIVKMGTVDGNVDENQGAGDTPEGAASTTTTTEGDEDHAATNDDGPHVAVEPAPAPEEEPPTEPEPPRPPDESPPPPPEPEEEPPAEPEPETPEPPPAPDEQPPGEPEPETDDEEPGEEPGGDGA